MQLHGHAFVTRDLSGGKGSPLPDQTLALSLTPAPAHTLGPVDSKPKKVQ
jgi:hypothetical protein